MKKILLTIDTEFYISEEEILGPKNKGGIDDILAMLNKYGVKATFFVDYYGAKIWGKSIYKRISEKILSNGHEIELHLHPEPGEKKPYLWQYSVDEQKVMLRYSIDTYREINGKDPDYFRAGSYSADDNLIGLLKDNNFHGDLSFQYKQRRCKISESVFQNMNRIKTEEEFIHIPTTVYKYNFLGKTKYNSVNFEWCTFGEFKDICGQIKSSSLDYFVLMMHSFGLLNRWDRKKVSFSKSRIKKLEKFLKFSIESGLEFETVSNVTAEAQNGKLNTSVDFLPIISDKKTIIKGVFEKLKNRLILKKKLRYSAYFAGITTLFFFLLFSYLFFFEHIDPGVKEIENVTADITSWNEDEDISTIESYFILLNNYKSKTIAHKDSNGILYREPFSDKKKYVYDFSAKRLYIPTDMSGKIIRDFDKYSVNGDTTLKKEMILYSKWLVDNAKIKENFAMWPYPFKMTKYDIEIGWCGSWALGNILSALSRSFVLTGDSLYYSVAQKGVNSFEVPIEEGGILFVDNNGDYWYDEYPSNPPSLVLNGHINGVLGLYDLWRISGDEKARELFDKGIETVVNNLDKFDMGFWSRYDLQYPYVADYFYHGAVHIPQLEVLYQITGKKIFKDYAEKWEGYFDEPYYSMYKLKILFDALHRRLTYKSFFTLGK